MDVDSSGAMVNKWSFKEHDKYLKFNMEKCIGCDLCRLTCPTSCIELGPVPEIASGELEGVPPILINFEKCAYCGLCYSICPTSAFEFYTETKVIHVALGEHHIPQFGKRKRESVAGHTEQ